MNRDQKLAIQRDVIAAWQNRHASDPKFNADDPTPEQATDLQVAMAVAMGKDSDEFKWLDALSKMTRQERDELRALYEAIGNKLNPQ